jgi:hypothetical protein
MFSRLIVTNITSGRGTLHCRKTHSPCRDQLVICGLYLVLGAVPSILLTRKLKTTEFYVLSSYPELNIRHEIN